MENLLSWHAYGVKHYVRQSKLSYDNITPWQQWSFLQDDTLCHTIQNTEEHRTQAPVKVGGASRFPEDRCNQTKQTQFRIKIKTEK